MTIDGINSNDIYMLGYVSNSLTGPYKPLNKTGLVLQMGLDPNDVTFTYSLRSAASQRQQCRDHKLLHKQEF